MWERSEMSLTTIYTARRVITMNPANPEGTAVAVRDGRVLGVGDLEELVDRLATPWASR